MALNINGKAVAAGSEGLGKLNINVSGSSNGGLDKLGLNIGNVRVSDPKLKFNISNVTHVLDSGEYSNVAPEFYFPEVERGLIPYIDFINITVLNFNTRLSELNKELYFLSNALSPKFNYLDNNGDPIMFETFIGDTHSIFDFSCAICIPEYHKTKRTATDIKTPEFIRSFPEYQIPVNYWSLIYYAMTHYIAKFPDLSSALYRNTYPITAYTYVDDARLKKEEGMTVDELYGLDSLLIPVHPLRPYLFILHDIQELIKAGKFTNEVVGQRILDLRYDKTKDVIEGIQIQL